MLADLEDIARMLIEYTDTDIEDIRLNSRLREDLGIVEADEYAVLCLELYDLFECDIDEDELYRFVTVEDILKRVNAGCC